MDLMTEAIDAGYLRSCHDLSEGGLAVASAEMAFSSGYGLELELQKVPRADKVRRNDYILFSESNSRFLVEVTEKRREEFEALIKDTACSEVGRVENYGYLSIRGLNGKQIVHAGLDELRKRWKRVLGG
jgi:phosphoribosylformylglycinamidine synthase